MTKLSDCCKLLGYYSTIEYRGENSDGHNEGYKAYHFVVEVNKTTMKFTATESFGSCGSGWTSASWGDIEKELSNYEGNDYVKCNSDISIPIENNCVRITTKIPKEMSDSIEECVLSTDKIVIVSSTGNGGCDYYPSGNITLNDSLFN